MAKKQDRFILSEKYGNSLTGAGLQMVLVDRVTGVNYIFIQSGYAGGLTPLLDADGKPVITPVDNTDI